MTEKKKIVENPKFTNRKAEYQRDIDLVEGGKAVENNAGYLIRHPAETDKKWEARQKRATYTNYASSICDVFTSAVWEVPPLKRELPPSLEKYAEDVDRAGTSANEFFRDVSEEAAKAGIHFVVADNSKGIAPTANRNLSESQQVGIRPFLSSHSALRVPAWEMGPDGLVWVVIDESAVKVSGPFEDPKTVTRYRIWTRTSWSLFEKDKSDNLVKVPGESGKHPCGEVPVRPLYFSKASGMVGESCIYGVASLMLRIYRMQSALDTSLDDTAFPQQGFYGFDPEEISDYIKSSSNGLASVNTDAKSEFIEPQGKSFAALEKSISADATAIREIALRMTRPDNKVGESAEAKTIDNKQRNSIISVFAQSCEDMEKWAWRMMAKWENEPNVEAIEVEYNKDFSVDTITSEMAAIFDKARDRKDISRATFWDILKERDLLPESFNPEDEEIRIKAEEGIFGDLD